MRQLEFNMLQKQGSEMDWPFNSWYRSNKKIHFKPCPNPADSLKPVFFFPPMTYMLWLFIDIVDGYGSFYSHLILSAEDPLALSFLISALDLKFAQTSGAFSDKSHNFSYVGHSHEKFLGKLGTYAHCAGIGANGCEGVMHRGSLS